MAIWRGNSKMPAVGPQIHVSHKLWGGLPDEYEDSAADAVSAARTIIQRVHTILQRGQHALNRNQQEALRHYFKFKRDVSSKRFLLIQATIGLTRNGLYGENLNIKVTHKHKKAAGYVNEYRRRFRSPKDGWTEGPRVKGSTCYQGAIHVDSRILDRSQMHASLTIIHEATHKFASTCDFGKRGYLTARKPGWPLEYRENGLTVDEALSNADSYAGFIVNVFWDVAHN